MQRNRMCACVRDDTMRAATTRGKPLSRGKRPHSLQYRLINSKEGLHLYENDKGKKDYHFLHAIFFASNCHFESQCTVFALNVKPEDLWLFKEFYRIHVLPISRLWSVAPNKDRTRSSACWRELLGGWGLGSTGVGSFTEGAADECTRGLGTGVPRSLASSACNRAISSSLFFSTDARSLLSRSSSFSSAAISSFSRRFSVWNCRLISRSRWRNSSSSSRFLLASSRRCSMRSLRRSSSRSSRVCLRSSTRCRLGGCPRNHQDHGCSDLPTAKHE